MLQPQWLLLTVDRHGAQLAVLLHLHPLLAVLHDSEERKGNGGGDTRREGVQCWKTLWKTRWEEALEYHKGLSIHVFID